MPVVLMIIDDDADDRELFAEAACELSDNISCVACAGGEDAVRILKSKQKKPDVIFLDLNMPRMSGKECLIKLKQIKALQQIPIVIYSTSKMEKDEIEVKQLGASAFLIKPSRQKDLMDAITAAINHEWDQMETPVKINR